MTERYYPSDGLLRGPRARVRSASPAHKRVLTAGRPFLLAESREAEFVTAQLCRKVRRFCGLWITGQSGRVGPSLTDLATCFRRFLAVKPPAQPYISHSATPKPECFRAALPYPPRSPSSMDQTGRLHKVAPTCRSAARPRQQAPGPHGSDCAGMRTATSILRTPQTRQASGCTTAK